MERSLNGLSWGTFAQPLAYSKVLGTQELPSWRHTPPLPPQCLRVGIPGSRVQGEDSVQGTGEVKTVQGGDLGRESGRRGRKTAHKGCAIQPGALWATSQTCAMEWARVLQSRCCSCWSVAWTAKRALRTERVLEQRTAGLAEVCAQVGRAWGDLAQMLHASRLRTLVHFCLFSS